ncbi:hypothetical protein BATDEDRAFT_88915 [Batrachochytrium dendrobatidis JAM81]|uniref:Gem-associated protein 2 n=1 Tax=Batrachochytrium dendrobatidis (strain JAM81 / FGSC 10211) TaxID=684364 RepID=F4P2K1_BATDJ|nr:uncharacterized protein BATDEDRAFT_88915 [Batrachochytrium dendrobatidis JAM81]EGF80147.1 hypothetical protein BATDEDRAFT_88915 [Batrachochytrium dendrobatidis JAM81]|eukprot:XP_006679188.1 hypothetical protein BATDEDRAFT_88915 [Batrachochytrium dendrobatidis JAM81]
MKEHSNSNAKARNHRKSNSKNNRHHPYSSHRDDTKTYHKNNSHLQRNSDWTAKDQDELRRPALPLVEDCRPTSLRSNEPPSSGFQYLLSVRKEAEAAQQVVIADIPEEVLNVPIALNIFDRRQQLFEFANTLMPSPNQSGDSVLSNHTVHLMPSSNWILTLIQESNKLRDIMTAYRKSKQAFQAGKKICHNLPPISDSNQWHVFCYGIAQNQTGSDSSGNIVLYENSTRTLPSLSMIGALSHETVLRLVQMHTLWLEESGTITPDKSKWIFALLMRLDSLLTGDEISLLRDLSKVCLRLRSDTIRDLITKHTAQKDDSISSTDTNSIRRDHRIVSCTMVISIVHHIFGQKDLL